MAVIIGIIIGLAAGLALGYWLWHQPPRPTTQSFRPAVVQSDGSVIVQRIPIAEPGKPAHKLPAGARETRRARIVVKPEPVDPGMPGCECKPADIDLSFFRYADGTDGMVASGADIDAARSMDSPIDDAAPERRHFIMLHGAPDEYGAMLGKRWGRVGIGVGIERRSDDGWQPQAGIEINW